MKNLELKRVDFEAYGQPQVLDYKEMLTILMESPANPQEGATISEIRKSIRVLDALEKADDNALQLEDADFDYLLQRVRGAKFTSNNKVFIDFVEDIEEAEE